MADAVAASAIGDARSSYTSLTSLPCTTTFGVPTDLTGMVLTPGVYCFASSALISGSVTLDGQGDSNSVFIFKIGSTLTTPSGGVVTLTNGTQPCAVFWLVGSSASFSGASGSISGNIIAQVTITATAGYTFQGALIALTGSITLDTNNVTAVGSCGNSCQDSPAIPTPSPIPGGIDDVTALPISSSSVFSGNGNATNPISRGSQSPGTRKKLDVILLFLLSIIITIIIIN